ncbi:MAG TPA: TonB-dependent receptor [Kiritimatiellia bacterium]|nr:TonB-dependent receptor [Kiritimatiellia bacterium]HMP33466.1 TonB-dependent receptor [Kiritimatiellia bacterium]
MKKTYHQIGSWVAALVVAGGVAMADGFRNPPEGMTAIGKIGGKIVYNDDASTLTHNPANLPNVTNNQLMASFTVGYGKREFEPSTGGKAESKDPWAVLPNFFSAWQVGENDRLVAGVGLTTPYGRATTFPKDSLLRYSTPYFTELIAVNLNPSLGYRVNDRLSVGGGISLLYSELDLRQIYPWSVATGNPSAPDGTSYFQGDGSGIGINLALSWDVTEKQRAVLTYRSSIEVDYEGDSKFTKTPIAGPIPALVTSQSDFETTIEFPSVVAAGYGIELTDKLRVEVNIEWVEHSTFDQLDIDAGSNTPFLPASTIPADWDDNWTYGIGLDYQLNDQLVLRAGYIYLESPIPSKTMLPSISEEDQSVISIGAGYTSGPHQIDVAYAYGLFNGRDVDNNVNPAFNGSYDFEAHLIGASYAYSF